MQPRPSQVPDAKFLFDCLIVCLNVCVCVCARAREDYVRILQQQEQW